MIDVRRSADRGFADHGWLQSRHTFSFAEYHDPLHMGFRTLRVLNEDKVEAGKGFAAHSHRDMEIISYVLDGELEHRDSLGTGSIIRRGDVQLMRAGTGVTHSEFNHSPQSRVHFLQIWILPDRRGLEPAYEQITLDPASLRNRLARVVSQDGSDGSLRVHQDVSMHAGMLDVGASVSHDLAPGRHAWIQIARGSASIGETRLDEGDGAAISGESRIDLRAQSPCEVLLFDLS
jgi:redox-sensitive bicupin YhaK (pirin superfamily)